MIRVFGIFRPLLNFLGLHLQSIRQSVCSKGQLHKNGLEMVESGFEPYPSLSKVFPTYSEIGVGVYQGEFVSLRRLTSDIEGYHVWSVNKLKYDDFRHIRMEVSEQLILAACFVKDGIQSYLSMQNLQKQYEIKSDIPLAQNVSHYSQRPSSLEANDSADNQHTQNKEILENQVHQQPKEGHSPNQESCSKSYRSKYINVNTNETEKEERK